MLQFLPYAAMALQAYGSYSAGRSAEEMADFEAGQLNYAAGQEVAVGQRAAIEERRRARLLMSSLRARAMGGASDVGVVNLAGDIAAEGEYRALTALYEGESRARSLRLKGSMRTAEGDAARRAGTIGAIGSVLDMGSSLYENYARPYDHVRTRG